LFGWGIKPAPHIRRDSLINSSHYQHHCCTNGKKNLSAEMSRQSWTKLYSYFDSEYQCTNPMLSRLTVHWLSTLDGL